MINEIIELPSNIVIIIKIKTKKIKFLNIDYKENSIPLNSKLGLKIIDDWVDKWGYIFRSLKKKTNNLSFDLSGGLDTRSVLSILMSSGIDLNSIIINSIRGKKNTQRDEDFKIANNISSRYNFKLNNLSFDNNSIKWSLNDTVFGSIYSKLGFHNWFYWKYRFYNKPRFSFTGFGGENIRGYPGYQINEYIKQIVSLGKFIPGLEKILYNSSMRFCKRNIGLLKKKKGFKNNYEISSDFYYKGRTRNHFGKSVVESFIANVYLLQPLMDPDIKMIKFSVNGKDSHDLIAYIYTRFAYDLIYFPVEGKRKINYQSIKKAKKLNNKVKNYEIKSDFNKNFYIDIERSSPVPSSNENKTIYNYLAQIVKTSKFLQNINKIYNNSVFDLAKQYTKNLSFCQINHLYGLISVATIIDYVSLCKKLLI